MIQVHICPPEPPASPLPQAEREGRHPADEQLAQRLRDQQAKPSASSAFPDSQRAQELTRHNLNENA